MQKYPQVAFSCTADDAKQIAALGAAMQAAGKTCGVLLDLDTGLGRTGVLPGDAAAELYQQIAATKGLAPGGLHWYDGQHHQSDLAERRKAVLAGWERATAFRDQLVKAGLAVPRIVAGGTGAFPIYAELLDPTLELSPGTVVLHDAGYSRQFPDLAFTPAAMLLTRVISRPGPDRVTCDLGYKACASDPPAGKRLSFPDLPDAEEVLQNEEHLVLRTSRAAEFSPGDELWAIPRHICPTTAMHRSAYIVAGGRMVEEWEITARDRRLTI
jgi:D-serine deaminase-like pyridoxal phosphate-dependent protein